jgi:hypothetical protein
MTVDEVWDIFKKKVLDAVDQTVPSKMINNNKKRLPWITKEIKALGITSTLLTNVALLVRNRSRMASVVSV